MKFHLVLEHERFWPCVYDLLAKEALAVVMYIGKQEIFLSNQTLLNKVLGDFETSSTTLVWRRQERPTAFRNALQGSRKRTVEPTLLPHHLKRFLHY